MKYKNIHTLLVILRISQAALLTLTSLTMAMYSCGAADIVWVEDALPNGAAALGGSNEPWNWVSANPTAYSGSLGHQQGNISGRHDQSFYWATDQLVINAGDILVTYVYLNPASAPSEIMLSFGTTEASNYWEHRAYWGSNLIADGIDGSVARTNMGSMPASGTWVRLEVAASKVGLEGKTLEGLGFTCYNGQATWDHSGKVDTSGGGGSGAVWVEDALPTGGAALGGSNEPWNWVSANPTPFSGNLAHQQGNINGRHDQAFYWATSTLAVNPGDVLVTYVYLNPGSAPSEIMLSFGTTDTQNYWEHRAYWGSNLIADGVDGTASRTNMGAMPSAGTWARLEVPADKVGLEGKTLEGMGYTCYNGQATWDYTGKTNSSSGSPPPQAGLIAVNFFAHQSPGLNATKTGLAATGHTASDIWNHYSRDDGQGGYRTFGVLTNLQTVEGSNSGAGLTINNAPAAAANGSSDAMYNTYLYPSGGGNVVITVTNVVAGSYDFYLYAQDANFQLTVGSTDYGTKSTPNALILNPILWQENVQYVRFRNVSLASGQTVTITSKPGLAGYAEVSGLQIAPSSSPATLPLLVDVNFYAHQTAGLNATKSGTAGTGHGSGDYWNHYSRDDGHGGYLSFGALTNLQNAEGIATGVGLTLANATQAYTNGSSDSMFNTYLYPSSGNATLTITNMPAGTYDFYLYGRGASYQLTGGSTNYGTRTLPNSAISNPISWAENNQYVRFTNVVLANAQSVTVIVSPGASGSAILAGLQISASSSGGTIVLPVASVVDYVNLRLPTTNDYALHVLTPTVLELVRINTYRTSGPYANAVDNWDFVNSSGVYNPPGYNNFVVKVGGSQVLLDTSSPAGFKRRGLYAPFAGPDYPNDLRLQNCLTIKLQNALTDNQVVEVDMTDPTRSGSPTLVFVTTNTPLRYSPAIHVSHEGYMSQYVKKAEVGYYLGTWGELTGIPTSFSIVDSSGHTVTTGTLTLARDTGWNANPAPYQHVYTADFSSVTNPGTYELMVPGMGASLPFTISDGLVMDFARAYALGLYHQRCGTNTAMPYTRFTHDICHHNPIDIVWPADQQFYEEWYRTSPASPEGIIQYGADQPSVDPEHPQQSQPNISPSSLVMSLHSGTINALGGHHDAGDFSRYTANCADLIHQLMFAVDSLPGVSNIDNLGIPESGDSIPDVLQEAKWEADFLANMFDTDGGVYFLVYPLGGEYEPRVSPDHGASQQVVWPKTSQSTAAAVAALAQCASSPLMKRFYPGAASTYLQKAQLGWQLLMNVSQNGTVDAFQKITHYGGYYLDHDELAWAACEIYLANKDANAHNLLVQPGTYINFDPSTSALWGWWRLYGVYGNAVRSYAFAVKSGKASYGELDAAFYNKCTNEIVLAGEDVLSRSTNNSYGTSLSDPTKASMNAQYYFSIDRASDVAAAYQFNPKASYISAFLANINYEAGANPVNVCFVTGMGWKRLRDLESEWHAGEYWRLPISGIPNGNIVQSFDWVHPHLEDETFPPDGGNPPYAFYDRWGDADNVASEFTCPISGHCLGALTWLAAQISPAMAIQPWTNASCTIQVLPSGNVSLGQQVTNSLQIPGMDPSTARIVWEAQGQDACFDGPTHIWTPTQTGSNWIEVEVQWLDGRRSFGKGSVYVSP
jgi:hypothetical protein